MMLLERKPLEQERCPELSSGRFLLYSHDGLGLGHTRRHLAIARAIAELAPTASILLALGADEATRLDLPPGTEVLKLPGLQKRSNDEYASRRLRISGSEILGLRSALLHAAVKAYRPNVVLVDKHPFGVKGEFRAGLEELRALGGVAALGLRDILDEPDTVVKEWSAYRLWERVSKFYDRALIYGEASVFDSVVEYKFPEALSRRTRFCGYVVNPDEPEPGTEGGSCGVSPRKNARPRIVATAGGGEDGFKLLETFLRVAASASWEAIAVSGPMMPGPELKTLEELAAQAKATLHRFVPNLPRMFRTVDALVCMGGYNTLAEAASRGVPTVCVPRTHPRREQLIRARTFERLGLLSVVEPEHLTGLRLERAINAILATTRERLLERTQGTLRFDGARQAARHLLELRSLSQLGGPAAERAPAL